MTFYCTNYLLHMKDPESKIGKLGKDLNWERKESGLNKRKIQARKVI